MTLPFQRHQKLRQLAQKQNQNQSSQFDWSVFLGKRFWIWDKQEHLKLALETNQQCCFQHLIGCPIKNGREYPLFDYEKTIFDAIENNQNIWIKKARGLGITTFLIRYLAWKVLYSSELDDKSIFIISGTREEFANYIKKKMEELFERKFPELVLESKYTELVLKKTWIKAMPTKNIKDLRGYMDAAYLFVDESDHFGPLEQQELEPAITAYEEKSNGKTIMVSTPNAPGGLFERIEKDKNSKYKKLFLDYTYGLDKIYDREFIEKKKLEPEFEREYNLAYLGKVGNTFHYRDIDRAIELGDSYSPDLISQDTQKVLGIDPGWGSSAFGLVLLEFINGCIQVRYAEEFERPRYEDMTSKILGILRGLNQWSLNQTELAATKIYIDAANPEFISSLKRAVGEWDKWSYVKDKLDYCKKYNRDPADFMTVIPVPFSTEAKNMLIHTKELLEYEKRPLIGINSKFDKLIVSLRTAVSDDQGKLDKDATSYDNVLDAFRLALKHFTIKQKVNQKPIIVTHY